MARRISDEFINDLLQGKLSEILKYVQRVDIPVKMTSLLRMKLTTHTRLSPS